MEEMFEHISKAKNCKSLLKKYLTKDTFEKLKDKKTSHNATLGDCIISGEVDYCYFCDTAFQNTRNFSFKPFLLVTKKCSRT